MAKVTQEEIINSFLNISMRLKFITDAFKALPESAFTNETYKDKLFQDADTLAEIKQNLESLQSQSLLPREVKCDRNGNFIHNQSLDQDSLANAQEILSQTIDLVGTLYTFEQLRAIQVTCEIEADPEARALYGGSDEGGLSETVLLLQKLFSQDAIKAMNSASNQPLPMDFSGSNGTIIISSSLTAEDIQHKMDSFSTLVNVNNTNSLNVSTMGDNNNNDDNQEDFDLYA